MCNSIHATLKELPELTAALDDGIWQIHELANIGERVAINSEIHISEVAAQFEAIKDIANRLHDKSQRLRF